MSVDGRKHCPIQFAGAALLLSMTLGGCAPQRPYRSPVPPPDISPVPSRIPPSPPSPYPPPSPPEAVRRPLPEETKIHEQDLKPKTPPSQSAKEPEPKAGTVEIRPAPDLALTPPPLPDDSSLLAKITPAVTPQRAASLRLTDEGSKLLDAGEPAKALNRLERTIVVDATNPYGYFYLAKAQFRLGRYSESLNFLAVAESRLSSEPFWLAEVHALRGDNYRAQGNLQRAEASYTQAIRLNSGNRAAADALSRMYAEPLPVSR